MTVRAAWRVQRRGLGGRLGLRAAEALRRYARRVRRLERQGISS